MALHAAAGLIALVAAIFFAQPGSLILGFAGACFLAFGLWGIADRELGERRPTISRVGAAVLLTARAIAAMLGLIAFLALLYGGLAIML